MSKIERLRETSLKSSFSKIGKKEMKTILGGLVQPLSSCSRTGSSDKCDATAVCGCPRYDLPKKLV